MKAPLNPKPRRWSMPLADLVGDVIHPVLARQGFGESTIVLNWDEIVGARLAAQSEPLRLQHTRQPPGRAAPPPATLTVRVAGPFAIELQHMNGLVIERINQHLGWRCVGRLNLQQGPIRRRPRAQPPRPATPADRARAAEAAAGIEEAPLKAALERLGAQVFSARRV